MDWNAVWEKAILPMLVAVVVPFVIQYLRIQTARVRDERMRRTLDDLVTAAEQMVPKSVPNANDKKLTDVLNAAPEGTPRVLVEAAVGRMKAAQPVAGTALVGMSSREIGNEVMDRIATAADRMSKPKEGATDVAVL